MAVPGRLTETVIRISTHPAVKMATDVVPMQTGTPEFPAKSRRDKALEDYRKRLIDHKELDDKLKKSENSLFFWLL